MVLGSLFLLLQLREDCFDKYESLLKTEILVALNLFTGKIMTCRYVNTSEMVSPFGLSAQCGCEGGKLICLHVW